MSIRISLILNGLLLGIGSFAYSVLGDDSVLLRIVLAFGWPSGAVFRLLGAAPHDVTQEIVKGIIAFGVSIGIYSCLIWLVLTIASRVKHQEPPSLH